MSKRKKFIFKLLIGQSDNNIEFDELCNLLVHFGFIQRIEGSHHIFYKDEINEILNIQPKNGKAKNYQVKQIRDLIIRYSMGEDKDA